MLPSQWAERNRELKRGESARFGPWRNANAPYGVGIMDAPVLLPWGQEFVFKKAAQVGVSEFLRNYMACMAETDPDPAMVLLPDEKRGKEIVHERWEPLFADTPCLARLHTGTDADQKSTKIKLVNGFLLWLTYAGSPAALASHPIRRIKADEVNKYPAWSGKEASPLALAKQRTKTYEHNRVLLFVSTPTTSGVGISLLFDGCAVKLYYWVPCPRCGDPIQLSWSIVEYSKFEDDPPETPAAHAERILAEKAAWYRCPRCNQRFDEREKPTAVRRGFWATAEQIDQGEHIGVDVPMGSILMKGLPRAQRYGMQIGSLPCTWVTCHGLAAKWVTVQHDASLKMDFINSDCGEDWHEQIATSRRSVFEEKCQVRWPDRLLPAWTCRMFCTVDVQLDHFYVVLRAWGPGLRSRRIWHQRLAAPERDPRGWDALYELAFSTFYPFEGKVRPPLCCDGLYIDTRYRTHEVWQFSLRDPRIHMVRGATKPIPLIAQHRQWNYTPPGSHAELKVWYYLVDTHRVKDELAGLVSAKVRRLDVPSGELMDHDQWELNSIDDPDYNRQMASEHKVLLRKGRGQAVEVWLQKTGPDGRSNHYLDCEVYQRAAAYLNNVDLITPELLEQQARAAADAAARSPGLKTPDGRPFLVTER